MMTISGTDDRAERRKAHLRETDPQFRDTMPDPAVQAAMAESGLSLARLAERVMLGYADRPATGERRTEPVTDPASGRRSLRLLPEFETHSYGELWERATALAAQWAARGLGAGDAIATIGFTSTDYVTLDLAAVQLGLVSVPLQPGASTAQLRAIVEETEVRLLAASPAFVGKAVEVSQRPRHAGLMGNRHQVQHGVGRAA